MNLATLIDRCFVKQPRLRRFVTRALYGSSDTRIDCLGTSLHINTLLENGYLRAERLIKRSSLLRDEVPVMLNLGHFARDGGAFVDAGANIGLYSSYFSRFSRFYPRFEVHAFEPDPSTHRRLQENARRLGFRCYAVALSEFDGELRFIRGAVSHVTTVVEAANAYSISGTEFVAKAMTLDSVTIASDQIILKIDVEGQEHSVLAGARRLFAEERVAVVYCDGWSDPAVPAFLESRGFDFYDGRSLEPCAQAPWSLLAVHPRTKAPKDRHVAAEAIQAARNDVAPAGN